MNTSPAAAAPGNDSHVTLREIHHQPACWGKTFEIIRAARPAIEAFLQSFNASTADRQVIITGAGTSAYAGIVLESIIRKDTQTFVRAVATTDLILEPDSYFKPGMATLLVSFARSGDSPESQAAIDLADQSASVVSHLIITCNVNGRIAAKRNDANALVIFLPDETNDRGLAMTSSFTNMLLAGILTFAWDRIGEVEKQVTALMRCGNTILNEYAGVIEEISRSGFRQAVFLGSGSLTGIAQESKLKLLELTVGEVVCHHETFVAFRHGPIAVMNNDTLLVYLFSSDPCIQQYERDLVNSLHKGKFRLGISQHPVAGVTVDQALVFGDAAGADLCQELVPVCAVLPGQMLGYFTSLHIGLNPDAPCTDGSYSRVVQGVHIYQPTN
ncbi:MAG: SIS domain-containing protein [Verrucomicrobiota bacterium]